MLTTNVIAEVGTQAQVGTTTNHDLELLRGGTVRGLVTSTGLAVTGTLSATGTLSGGTSGTGYSFSGSAPATSLTLASDGRLTVGTNLLGGEGLALNGNGDSGDGVSMVFKTLGVSKYRIGRTASIIGNSSNELCIQAVTGLGINFYVNGSTQAAVIDSSGNLGIGTSSPAQSLDTTGKIRVRDGGNTTVPSIQMGSTGVDGFSLPSTNTIAFITNSLERARIDSSGNLLVGKTVITFATAGARITPLGQGVFTVSNDEVLAVNRLTNDGKLVGFYQDTSEEGNISVSGTTVSYNGGHLSRWAQMLTKPELFKGTVMSNLDEMNVYTKDGQPVDNEQLNKVKVSDVEGDVNVAGVFVNWSYDEQHSVDEINMAMTGDMIIRIAQGVTVARGDLLMSAGDGTAKPQGDDIVRSKTVAKVTSNHITCTYADGSYCVPCVLMAC